MRSDARLIVVLDPGHGGNQRGGGSRGQIDEADYCLEMCRRVQRLYERRKDTEVLLTRDADRSVSHDVRVKRSREAGAHLVISVHINSQDPPYTMRGFRSFIWPGNLRSRAVGEAICQAMPNALRSPVKPLHVFRDWYNHRGWKRYPGKICAGHAADTVLVELGFITWDKDYQTLLPMSGRIEIANAIAAGIEKYREVRT